MTAPDKAWFLVQIESAGLNSRKVADMLGLNRSLFSKRISGTTRFTASECADMARILKVPVDDVMRAAGIAIVAGSAHKAPIDGVADLAGDIHPPGRSGPRNVEIPAGLGALHAIAIRGGALDGAYAFYKPSSSVQADAVGSLAIVTSGKALRMGRLRKGRERGRWDVMALAGETVVEGVSLTAAAPVLWIRP